MCVVFCWCVCSGAIIVFGVVRSVVYSVVLVWCGLLGVVGGVVCTVRVWCG